jgi:adenine-specific DNA methylase
LLIGINYIGSKVALKGCINDVINIKKTPHGQWIS